MRFGARGTATHSEVPITARVAIATRPSPVRAGPYGEIMTESLGPLEAKFRELFSNWELTLPAEDVAQRRRGRIIEKGWTVWYLFGRDERGEYLDYYASHRMTDDTHERIYADGTVEALESLQGMRLSSQDPVEDKRLADAYYAKNARIGELLREKGFGLYGDEPLAISLGRTLRTGGVGEGE